MMGRMKVKRQKAITEIVTKRKMKTQHELAAELKRKSFDVTQATVSRDIAELRLQRVRGTDNVSYYVLPQQGQERRSERHLKNVLQEFVLSASCSSNLVVIKTSPGGAQGVASALDGAGWKEVLGTVAGDDTILIIAANVKSGSVITKRLNELREV